MTNLTLPYRIFLGDKSPKLTFDDTYGSGPTGALIASSIAPASVSISLRNSGSFVTGILNLFKKLKTEKQANVDSKRCNLYFILIEARSHREIVIIYF
jgi:hypothetical protein